MPKYPVTNPTRSFWQTTEDPVFGSYQSTESLPSETNTLIVGSGFAGASTAYYFYKSGFKDSLVMLEARELCSGASGRNGGHLKPDLYMAYDSYCKRFGEKVTADIFNFEYDHLPELKGIVEEEGIACDFVLTRSCDVHLTREIANLAQKNYMCAMNNPYAKYKHDLQINYGEEAKVLSKVEDSEICITYSAGHLWVFKFVSELLKKSVSQGMQVHANTLVLETTKLDDGRHLVKTTRGDIITQKLILATNAYTSAIEPKLKGKIIPFKGICTRIIPKDANERTPHLTNTYGIRFSPNKFDYLINRPDGSIIVGGARRKITDIYKFYDNADDSTTIDEVEHYFDGYMNKIFYTWKGVKEEVSMMWSGIMGFTNDELPYVGEIPGEKNKFVIAGFHGHGMPRVLLSAKGLVEYIKGGDLSIPEPFKVTSNRLQDNKNMVLSGLRLNSKM